VHDAEDRAVRADANRERKRGDEGEARPLEEASNGAAEILPEGVSRTTLMRY
jgi:hypothetical protein